MLPVCLPPIHLTKLTADDRDPSVDMNQKPAPREKGAPVYPNDGMYGGGGVQWGGPGGQVGAGMQVGGSFAG
jgi:hypothetical protein